MENNQDPPVVNQLENFFNIAFDEATRKQIKQAAQWAKISALCAFIGYAVTLVVAIFTPRVEDYDVAGGTIVHAGNMVGVVLTIAFSAFINYFLYRFAVSTAKGMETMDTISTNDGFNNLRRYFKILGILIIVGLSIGVLVMLIGILGGLASR